MIINNAKEILSKEGTTVDDNLAVLFYALSLLLIQNSLSSISSIKQVWQADDATGAGEIISLKQWWDIVISEGRNYGYYANESKSWIILKNNYKLEEAKKIFADSTIKYTSSGKRAR